MYKIVYNDKRKVTAPVAEYLLSINTYNGQRDIKEMHLQEIKKLLETDQYTSTIIGIAVCKHRGGKKVLMNGQTTATAILQTGKVIDVLWQEAECSNDLDVAHYYATFDTVGKRGRKDISRAMKHALRLKWPEKIVSLVMSAALLNESKKIRLPSEKQDLLKKYQAFGEFLFDMLKTEKDTLQQKELAYMLKKPVIYSLYLSYTKDENDCRFFWNKIKTGEKLDNSDPAKKLRDYLLRVGTPFTTSPKIDSINGDSPKTAAYHEVISKCITAWNAFRRKEKTDLKYYRDKGIPKAI